MSETVASVRSLFACLGVGLVVYSSLGFVVRDDALFVRYGTTEEIAFVWRDAARAVRADRRTVWIVGSSVIREAFDAEQIERWLNDEGVDVDVVKFGFDRGAPAFSRPLVRRLDVRPGDLVITSVAEDNFVRGWIHDTDDLALYLRFALDPRDVWTLPNLGFAERVEASLTMLPPRGFHRHRDAWIDGFNAWGNHALGLGPAPVARKNVHFQPYTVGGMQHLIDPAIVRRRVVRDDALILDASHENYAALLGLIDEVEARGAAPVLLFVPHHPEFGDHFISEASASRFQAVMSTLGPPYVPLAPTDGDGYRDWNHPNEAGRAHYSREVARWLALGVRP